MLMACALDDKLVWDKQLPYVEFSYNNSHQASLQMSPFQALHGRNCQTMLQWDQPGKKAGVRSRHFASSRREYQDGSGEYEDIIVQAAKLCRHQKKRAEF
jgi:hypothetical protein